MRGHATGQAMLFSYVSPEARVPASHPLRTVKTVADQILKKLSPTFKEMYSHVGRPSIPPERLLKAQLLLALFSVRSDRLLCEMLDYNILFRWFLDMALDEPTVDHSTFSANRDRLLQHQVAQQFFDEVVSYAREADLLSDEHFTVDGTLIEAHASLKSFKAQKPPGGPPAPPEDPGNPRVDFHGETRANATHQSTTDPEARLVRKGRGKEARLSFSGHVLMENRHGLCVQLRLAAATGTAEREAAEQMLDRHIRHGSTPKTLAADKGYHATAFVQGLRARHIRPHIAQVTGRHTPGLDRRLTRHPSYALSQRIRKRVEEIFGWMKTIGGLHKSRFRGVARTELYAHFVGSAYNLLRIGRLQAHRGTG